MGNVEGGAQFDVSQEGSLAYLGGPGPSDDRQYLTWVDRSGTMTRLSQFDGAFSFGMKLSPDDQFLAIGQNTSGNVDIWTYDLQRNIPNRLTFAEAADGSPVWAADGQHVYFSSNRRASAEIYRVPVGGAGKPEVVVEGPHNRFPDSVSPDNKTLIFHENHPESDSDLWVFSLESGESKPFLATRFKEVGARFSPNGRWVAYISYESGTGEVYVVSFPEASEKWRVSIGGGANPRWSRDGTQLFFRQERKVFGVTLTSQGEFLQVGKPELLFDIEVGFPGSLFDLASDGEKLLIVQEPRPESEETRRLVNLTLNWDEVVQELLIEKP
jgi:serine/threonine-protein kinase